MTYISHFDHIFAKFEVLDHGFGPQHISSVNANHACRKPFRAAVRIRFFFSVWCESNFILWKPIVFYLALMYALTHPILALSAKKCKFSHQTKPDIEHDPKQPRPEQTCSRHLQKNWAPSLTYATSTYGKGCYLKWGKNIMLMSNKKKYMQIYYTVTGYRMAFDAPLN